jgi:RNA recognition motif-containing protein
MGNKLYVGNLAYSVRDDSLQEAFAQFGSVTSAKVMMDRDTGRSKGFGFVEMGSDAEAQAAINGMNGQALEGRAIVVNEARPREDRPGGFGGGGGGRSGGGGGYGGGGGGYGGGGGGRSGGGGYGGGGGGRSGGGGYGGGGGRSDY